MSDITDVIEAGLRAAVRVNSMKTHELETNDVTSNFHDRTLERPATLNQRLFRVLASLLALEIIPSSLRIKSMRLLGCNISQNAKAIWASSIFKSNDINVGSGVFINSSFYFDGMAMLSIGKNVAIGPRVTVITGSHHIGEESLFRCSLHAKKEPVTIEDGCWIGANVTILPGVVVARGCVIGAGSIVTHSTSRDGLYLGIPARRVRDLAVKSVVDKTF